MSTEDAEPELERVALFPLHVVLFPGGLLPLRIFEPRYLRMVSECMRSQSPFAVAAILEGKEVGGVATTASSGTLARIVDWEQGQDGLLNLVCEGEQSVRIVDVAVEKDNLMRASIRRLPATEVQDLPPRYVRLQHVLDDILNKLGEPFDRLRRDSPSADHVANRLIELLPLPLDTKQALFETHGSVARLERLAGLIRIASDDDQPA